MKRNSSGTGIPIQDRLIYALDRMTPPQAVAAVRHLHEAVHMFKIGLPLILQGGLEVANQIANAVPGKGIRVFLDLKAGDIPETMFSSLEEIARRTENIVFVTIHVPGVNIVEFVKARAERKLQFKIIALTLLTSMDDSDLKELMIEMPKDEYVVLMATRARNHGCDGVICSGQEVELIKNALGTDFIAITPGIRPTWGIVEGDDQKRVVTPAEAIRNGADHIVVGRPIRNASDPLEAAWKIRSEIASALANDKGSESSPNDPRLFAVG